MDGAKDDTVWDAARIAKEAADVHGDKAAEHLRKVLKARSWLKGDAQAAENKKVEDAIALIERGEVRPSGNLYDVSLRWPDAAREARDPLGPQHFLDWDAPLSKQPEAAKDLIRDKLKTSGYLRANDNGPRQLQSAFRAYKNEHGGMAESQFETLHDLLGRNGPPGIPPDQWAAQAFRDSGIPGIRYLDQGSRGAGQGTSNYVIFDDALAEILARNGIPVR